MSNFIQPAFDPVAGIVRDATWIDDYFGPHKYGVQFDAGGPVYRPDQAEVAAAGECIADLRAKLVAAEADRDRLLSILDDVRAWAEHRCPCENEKPDPCPLCGELADGGICRSVEKSFPGDLGERIRHALTAAERVRSLNAEQRGDG